MAEHLTIPGALEWDTVERHSIATLRYAGGKEHDVKYVSEVAYDALKAELKALQEAHKNPPAVIGHRLTTIAGVIYGDHDMTNDELWMEQHGSSQPD